MNAFWISENQVEPLKLGGSTLFEYIHVNAML